MLRFIIKRTKIKRKRNKKKRTKINKNNTKLYEIADVPSDGHSRSRAYAHDNDLLSDLIIVAQGRTLCEKCSEIVEQVKC